MPTAKRLDCEAELADVERVLAVGASYQRQRAVAAAPRRRPEAGGRQPARRDAGRAAGDRAGHRRPARSPGRPTAPAGTRHDAGRREARRRGRRLGRRATRPSWSPPAGTCTRTRSSPSPSSRPPPTSSTGCARPGSRRDGCRPAPAWCATSGRGEPVVVLRADIDALPLADLKDVPYASTARGPLPRLRARRPHDRRCSASPWRWPRARRPARHGAAASSSRPRRCCPAAPPRWSPPACSTAPRGRSRCTATPRCRSARVGLRTGAITAACDRLDVTLTGPGGHTARPQLTVDLVDALGRLITDVPALLSRQVDPRAGHVAGLGRGQRRRRGQRHPAARPAARHRAGARPRGLEGRRGPLRSLVARVARHHGRRRATSTTCAACRRWSTTRAPSRCMRAAALETVSRDRVVADPAEHGRGGLRLVRRGRARSRSPGSARTAAGPPLDLHRGTFDVDERAIGVGVRMMARTALHALEADAAAPAGSAPPAAPGVRRPETLLPDEQSTRSGNPTMSSTDQQADAHGAGDAECRPSTRSPTTWRWPASSTPRPATSGATWSPACCARPAASDAARPGRGGAAPHRRHRRHASHRSTPRRTPPTCRPRSACRA